MDAFLLNQQIPNTAVRSWKETGTVLFRSRILFCEELVLRQEKKYVFSFATYPDKKDNDNFCISSRGKVKTLEPLNTRLKYITEKNGLPIITMYDLRDMFVWILLEKDCPWEEIQKLTGGVKMERFLGTS